MPQRQQQVVRAAGTLAFAAAAWTAAFYLTAVVYDSIGRRPPAVVAQLINSLLGVFVMVVIVLAAGMLYRRPRGGPFGPIIDALQQIAKGDFSTRLDDTHPDAGPVGQLVQSVNNLALELDQMERMRQAFISDVSHEIQSPLTSIQGFARALKGDDLSVEDRRRYLTIIEAEGMRLSRLSANLLELASLESDRIKVEMKPYRLDRQLRNLILACEPQWTSKRLQFEVELADADINADEDLLGRVWLNLINNSIKFTPEGGMVRVSLERQGDQLVAIVADTGIGIAVEDLPHVFERFYKADKSRQLREAGNGLGLSIAKRIVELHGGVIAVRSQPGAGAAFTVDLPAR